MATPRTSKTERIDVRASTPVKQLLQEAARACHKNVSDSCSTKRSGRHSKRRLTARCSTSRA
jgi:hypothetical protein